MGKREARQRDQRVETGGRNKDIGNGSGEGGDATTRGKSAGRACSASEGERAAVQRCSEGEWALFSLFPLQPADWPAPGRFPRAAGLAPGCAGVRRGALVGFFTPLVGWISWMIGCPSASACFCWGC